MAYVSLYRKYRSQTFGDLIGQDHVVRTIQNAIASGRIAHAYLFTGPRGTGKTSTARLLAKALNCESGPTAEPCNQCHICTSITDGSCIDVVEMDAASESGVDEVRETIVSVAEYRPVLCRYKVFIIDEVHDLSGKAFDALLKTIEEPPAHIVFVLATTEFNKVPATIRSRCQKYEFHRANLHDLVRRLSFVATSEGLDAEPAALNAIARMADGGYRDALTLLEQVMLTVEGPITLQAVYDQLGLISDELADSLIFSIKERDVPKLLELVNEVARMGRDPRALLESLLHRMADLTRAAYGVETGDDSVREASMRETAARMELETLLRIRGALADAHRVIRDISLPRIWLESELVRIASHTASPAESHKPRHDRQESSESKSASSPPAKRSATKQSEPKVATPTSPKKQQAASVEVTPEVPTPKSVDPQWAEQDAVWQRCVLSITGTEPQPGLHASQIFALKVQGSRVVGFKDNLLQVEVENRMHSVWLVETEKRRAYLHEHLHAAGGVGWQVTFVVAHKEQSATLESETVELTLEGDKLVQAAKELLSSDRPATGSKE